MNDFIPIAVPHIGLEEAEAVRNQVASGWISMGDRVEELEGLISAKLDVKYVIAVNSGTAALHVALIAMGVKPGDDVLVPCLSYISSANAVLYCGAQPIFIEEDIQTLTVGAEEIERKLTPNTKAIIVVDLKGLPVDYDAVKEVAEARSIPVLGDSAQAFGSAYKGIPVGTQATMHAFSMFPNKTITCGEGGFITTNNTELVDLCRRLRNQGQINRYIHNIIGYNYRLTDIAAAIAIQQLKKAEWILSEKDRIATYYTNRIKEAEIIKAPFLPFYASHHCWFAYSITLAPGVDRNRMINLMQQRGIDSRVGFPPIPLQPIYKEMFKYKTGDFPRAEFLYSRLLDIPCWAGMSNDQMERVIETTLSCAEKSFSEVPYAVGPAVDTTVNAIS